MMSTRNILKTTVSSFYIRVTSPSPISFVLGGYPRILSKTLCPSDRQCFGVHPHPWLGPPWCEAWKYSSAGQSLLPGEAGGLWPCPEERNPDTFYHRNPSLYGPWTLFCSSARGPERGDCSTSECGAKSGYLGIWCGYLLHPHRLLPLGTLCGLGWLLRRVCRLVENGKSI